MTGNLELSELGSDGWLDGLPSYQQTDLLGLLNAGKTEEQIAEIWLNRTGPEQNAGFGADSSLSTYFSNFRAEMDAFICGDERYKKDREKAVSLVKSGGKDSLVSFVALCIAAKIGLAAVVLTPAVALLLSVVGRMGVTAYCRGRGRGG